jgi:LPXTG-motif cell wall-anchored protein
VVESTTTAPPDFETQGATIPTTTTTVHRSAGRLPITGSDAVAQLFFGLSLLAGGALLAFRARGGLNRS